MGLLDGLDRSRQHQDHPGGGLGAGIGSSAGSIPGVGGLVGGALGLDFNRLAKAEELYGGVDPSGDLRRAAYGSERFGMQGRQGYGQMTGALQGQRDYLNRLMQGQDSMSAEQLRQGLQQVQNQQMSMAAGARPSNAAMAARNASLGAALAGGGMSGQAAMAGIAERQAANQALSQLNLGQRQQDLNAALGGQQNALTGYGAIEQNRTNRYGAAAGAPTTGEQVLGGIQGVASLFGAGGGGGR